MSDRRGLQERFTKLRDQQLQVRMNLARKVAAVLRHTKTPDQDQERHPGRRPRGRDFDLDM